jgi:ABC-type glycerol-3-phosphate transport system substrate-binding protein
MIKASRRQVLRYMAIGSGAALLAACQPKAPQVTEEPTPVPEAEAPVREPAAPVELRLHVRHGAEGTKHEMAIEAYEATHPNVQIKLEAFPGAEYAEKLMALSAGGVLGDLAFAHIGFYYQMADAGFWKILDPLIEQHNYDLSEFVDTGLEHIRWDGSLYALPYKGHTGPSGIFYNKEILEEVGITDFAPQDYDEIVEVALAITRDTTGDGRTDRWGYLNYGHGGWAITGHMRAWGVNPVSPIFGATTAELNGERQMESVLWLHDLIHKHKVSPIPGDLDYKEVFLGGAGGFRSGGLVDWGDRIAIGDRFTLAWASMPEGPGGQIPGFYNHDQMCMNSRTENVDEAWEFLAYLCGREHGIRLGMAEGGGASSPGMRYDVWGSEELAQEVPPLPMFREHLDQLQAHWYAENLQTFKAWGVMDMEFGGMLMDPTPPTKADFDRINAAVQDVLDEPRL